MSCPHECASVDVQATAKRTEPHDGAVSATFFVAGLDCPNEGKLIDEALGRTDAASDWVLNYVEGSVTVFVGEQQDLPSIERALSTTGMHVSREKTDLQTVDDSARFAAAAATMSAALLALVAGIAAAFGLELVSILSYALAIAVGGVQTFRHALTAVRRRILDMHVLMTLAVFGAMAIGEWLEGAVVVVLFAVANTLETMSLARARSAINALLDLTPERAIVRREGSEHDVPVDQVAVGECVIVKPGQRVPLDGVVLKGRSGVNQAPITGESRLVSKAEGDPVYAGSLNGDGVLELRVSGTVEESMPARIRRLVDQAQMDQAPSQRFVDAFAAKYTPAVVVAAVLVCIIPPLFFGGLWSAWFYNGLVLLVIACPCALVISTPVAIVSHLAVAAREGILIKGGESLERLGRVCSVVFDKTGTLTRGTPHVAHVASLNGYTEHEVLAYAAAVETHATHPLASVICQAAKEAGVQVPAAAASHTHPGSGVHATVDGRDIWVGSLDMATDGELIDRARAEIQRHEDHGETVVAVGSADEPFGVIALSDTVRDEASTAVAQLREAGLHNLYMLTGDNRQVADNLAADLGLDKAIAELLPDEKLEAVQALLAEDHAVAMIGDGINDAPALAAASVGVAMSSNAAAVTIEAADVVIARDDLRALPRAIELGRGAMRIVRQNVALALGLKAIVLVMALFGFASLWLAILADMGASLLVIANALRPLRPHSA